MPTHHNGDESNHTRVNSGGGPRGPSTLGGTGNNKLPDLMSRQVLDEGSGGVHGTDRSLSRYRESLSYRDTSIYRERESSREERP